MIKIDIISGFLGAGKTTLINRLIREAYKGEKVVLIENEFGEIGIDGGFLRDAGVEITEMNSGCICCSLVGDFSEALKKVASDYTPDRITIEPSGVGKLSDVTKAVASAELEGAVINSAVVVVDVNKCKMYMKNFGEFFNDQIEHAGTIVLSRSGDVSDEKLKTAVELLRKHNDKAVIITTPWEQLEGKQIALAIERKDTLSAQLDELIETHEHHHHHDEECDCGCHDHEHHHHHHHDEECDCGCHDHEHHHHHADDVFSSWGVETTKKFAEDEINNCLEALEDMHRYGMILRAKGIVQAADGRWIHFDYVPGEADVRFGCASVTGRLCVIGSKLDRHALEELFGTELR